MNIIVEPNIVESWKQFSKKPNSIALDGYVFGKPASNISLSTFNFNHHEEVDRLSTRCTSSQVYLYLKQGLSEHLTDETNIFVNDCDHDVCLSSWLLLNNIRVTSNSEPLLNRLIFAVDMLDTCAGNYPLDTNSTLFKQTLWIFQPFNIARHRGIHLLSSVEMLSVIMDVHSRIDKYLIGEAKLISANTEYETLISNGQKSIPIIKEIGLESRTSIFKSGISCFVSLKGGTGNSEDPYIYSLVKLVPLCKHDLQEFYNKLNSEDSNITKSNFWSGSNTCGGSPRETGSLLSPQQVFKILNES